MRLLQWMRGKVDRMAVPVRALRRGDRRGDGQDACRHDYGFVGFGFSNRPYKQASLRKLTIPTVKKQQILWTIRRPQDNDPSRRLFPAWRLPGLYLLVIRLYIRAPLFNSGRGLQIPRHPFTLPSLPARRGASCHYSRYSRFLARLLAVAMPPDRKLAAPSPHDGNINREHEQAERDHPEANHRQEADQPSRHEQEAKTNAQPL